MQVPVTAAGAGVVATRSDVPFMHINALRSASLQSQTLQVLQSLSELAQTQSPRVSSLCELHLTQEKSSPI